MKIFHKVNYKRLRSDAYPSVEDQLDMIWHSMSRSEIPRSEPFYSSIAAVKNRIPKCFHESCSD